VGKPIEPMEVPSNATINQHRLDRLRQRLTSAHQFIRTLCITYAVAIGGAVLLFVVGRQVGDVEVVRDVLSGEADAGDVEVGSTTRQAVGDGLAWVLGVCVLTSVAVMGVTRRLAGQVRREILT
jgi:hypothetical protein